MVSASTALLLLVTGVGSVNAQADLGAMTNPVIFGPQLVGEASAELTIPIANSGMQSPADDATLSLPLTITGADADSFAVATSLPVTLAAGDSAPIGVVFTPSKEGLHTATLEVQYDAPSLAQPETLMIALQGRGPDIGLSEATPFDFGAAALSSTSSVTVTITNHGDDELEVASMSLVGPGCSEFALSDDPAPITLDAEQTTMFTVDFVPTMRAVSMCTVRVVSNDSAGSPLDFVVLAQGEGSQLQVSPLEVAFGDHRVNTTSAPASVTIDNVGELPLMVTEISIPGTSGDFQITAPQAPFSVSGGDSQVVEVQFSPSAPGQRDATLAIETDADVDAQQAVSLSGFATQGVISVSPSSYEFGAVLRGAIATRVIEIENTGDAAVTISLVELGGDTENFSIAAGAVQPVAPIVISGGDTHMVSVRCSPTSSANFSATLSISTDADSAPQNPIVDLTCSGVEPNLAVEPGSSLNFGDQLLGVAATPQTFMISNDDNGNTSTLNVSLVVAGVNVGDFAVTAGGCVSAGGCALAPGASQVVSVVFTPGALGTRSARLEITSDDFQTPLVLIDTDGRGVQPNVAVSPVGPIDFGSQLVGTESTPARSITISNTDLGVTSSAVVQVLVVGENPGDFVVTDGNCLDPETCTLAPGDREVANVVFAPTASGERTAIVRVTSDDQETPTIDVPVLGAGLAPEATLVLPVSSAIDFGDVVVGGSSVSSRVVLENTGNSSLAVESVALAGDDTHFAIAEVAVPAEVLPGGQAEWGITCRPTTSGDKSATFTIRHADEANSPNVVTLSCSGTEANLSVIPEPITFADTRVCESATPRSVRLQNDGTAQLTITAVTTSDSVFPIVTPPTLPTELAPNGGFVELDVGFAPTQMGTTGGILTIESTDPGGDRLVALSGTGLLAQLTVDSLDVDFGGVRIDESGEAQTLTVTNVGEAEFSLQDVSIDNAVDFTVRPVIPDAWPTVLEPGGVATFQVVAAPQTLGPKSASLTIRTDVPTPPCGPTPVVVTASVVGVIPDITATPGAVEFGASDVQASVPFTRELVVTNTGTATLTVSRAQIAGPQAGSFSLVNANVPVTIRPGFSFAMTVAYEPVVESTGEQATLRLTSDARGGTTIDVPLSGQGVDRHIAVQPGNLTFPRTFRNPAEPAQIALGVRNTGEAPLAISMAVVGGAGRAAFRLVSDIPMVVSPNARETVTVEFAPDAAGEFEAELIVTNDDSDSPMVRVGLSGAGIVPNVAVSPAAVIDIGRTAVGVPQTVSDVLAEIPRVINMEDQQLQIRDLVIADMDGNPLRDGVFSVVDFEVGTMVEGMTSLPFEIEFVPDAPQVFEGIVEVYVEDDPVRVAFVAVRGEGVEVELRGGGCAASERNGAFLCAMVLLILVRVRRNRPTLVAAVCACIVTGSTSSTWADATRNLDMRTFAPTPSVAGHMIAIESPAVAPHGAWAVGLSLNHAVNPLKVISPQVQGMTETPISGRTSAELGIAYALMNRVEFSILLPLIQQSGDQPRFSGLKPAEGAALGDVEVNARVSLIRSGILAAALSAGATVPTASDGEFAGAESTTGRVRGIVGVARDDLRVALNAGLRIRGQGQLADVEQGNELTYGVAGAVPLSRRLSVVGEVFGAVGLEASAQGTSPLETTVGARYRIGRAVFAAGIGRGLMAGIGAPDVRVFAHMGFASASQPSARRTPPKRVRVGEPGDNDGDGIANAKDKCPNNAEDADNFEDDDGCPDLDNDADSLDDRSDQCPLQAEDRDGFEDEDGCPDPDNDNDGLVDTADKCPNESEDADGFEDGDGCDDPDNDGDGLLDVLDQCPMKAESINGNRDEDGCPDEGESLVILGPDRLEILEPIRFVRDSDRLAYGSENVLGQVAAHIRAHYEFARVRVAVHVHPRGVPEDDRELSTRRAKRLIGWLQKWGIEPQRLEARGYGSTRLLVPKTRRGAKTVNDRVEFVIIRKRIERPHRR